MATVLYLNSADATGVVPNAKQSSDTITYDAASSYATYSAPAKMTTTAGSNNRENVSDHGQSTAHYTHYGTWVSEPLNAQTWTSWTVTIGLSMKETSTQQNNYPRVYIYKWLANDTFGSSILALTTSGTEVGTGYSLVTYFSGTSLTNTTFAAGDRVVIEVECSETASNATTRLQGIQFDGADSGSFGSYVSFSGTISFITTTLQSVSANATFTPSVSTRRTSTFRSISADATFTPSVSRKITSMYRSISASLTFTALVSTLYALLQRKTEVGGTYADLAKPSWGSGSYDDYSGSGGNNYYYRIAKYINGVSQGWSNEVHDFWTGGNQQLISASVTFTVSVSRIATFYRTISANATFTQTLSRLSTLYRSLSANATFTTTIGKALTLYRTISASLASTVSIGKIATRLRAISANATFTVAVSAFKTIYRTISASATFTVSLSRIATFKRTLVAWIGSIYQDTYNFESGDLTGFTYYQSGSGSATVTTDAKHSGTYGVHCDVAGSSGYDWVELYPDTRTSYNAIKKVSFWYKVNAATGNNWLQCLIYEDENHWNDYTDIFTISGTLTVGDWTYVEVDVDSKLRGYVSFPDWFPPFRVCFYIGSQNAGQSCEIFLDDIVIERASMTPTLSRLATLYRSITTSLASTVSITRQAYRTLSANLSFTSILNAVKQGGSQYYQDLYANATFTVGISNLSTRYRTISASLASTVSITKALTIYRTISASLPFTVSIAKLSTLYRSISVSLPFTVTIGKALTLYRSISATLASTVSISQLKSKFVTLSVSLASTVSISKALTLYRSISANATFTVAISKLLTMYRTLSVSATFSPTVSRLLNLYRTLSVNSPFTAALQAIKQGGSQYYQDIYASATFTVSLARQSQLYRTLSAPLTFTVLVGVALSLQRTLSASATFTVSIIRQMYETLSRNASFTVSVSRLATRYRTISVNSPFTVSIVKRLTMYRLLSVIENASVSLSRRLTMYRTFSVTEQITPALSRLSQLKRTISASLSFIASLFALKRVPYPPDLTPIIYLECDTNNGAHLHCDTMPSALLECDATTKTIHLVCRET